MNKVALLPGHERRQLFQEAASSLQMHPAIVEKDFWVCWVLKRLFRDEQLKKSLVFKGGTSLSKVYGLIDRFSEDIDLVLDWRLLGYGPEAEDPFGDLDSNAKRHRFNAEANRRAAAYIAETLVPKLARVFAECPDVVAAVNDSDGQAVNVSYPASFSLHYLRPIVLLEIGPLASWVPSASHVIRPYAGEAFPEVFDELDCPVVAISAERTFWEKATILHQQAHRTNVMPIRYSRHYYDLSRLAGTDVRRRALEDLKLLQDVVDFKQRFYPSAWARYEEATPGTFRLIPESSRLQELRKDYSGMSEMIYRNTPTFDEIVSDLSDLEQEINGLIP